MIETAVRALYFEKSNSNNVHENASAFANNIANWVVGNTVMEGRNLSLCCIGITREVITELEPLSRQ